MSGFWESNLILRVRTGSRAYGLDTPESDEDSRGVCIPPKDVLLGLERFEQHESEGGDHVVYGLEKFARLALQGNPNIVETAYTGGEDLLFCDELGERLREVRASFLSRRVGERFAGYALDQRQRMDRHRRWLVDPPDGQPTPGEFGAEDLGGRWRFPNADRDKAYRAAKKHWDHYRAWRENRNPARAELERRYGYDTKHAMHLVRLLRMGREILTAGEVLVRRPDAEELRAIRAGALSYEELIVEVDAALAELPELVEESPLPVEPDHALVGALVVELHERFLARHA